MREDIVSLQESVKEDSPIQAAPRSDKRIHVALPIRVTYWDKENKPGLELACTYDISPHGARVTGLRCAKQTGEIIAVERGRNKAFCRVVWIGEPNSELRGQVGIQCVETERVMWEAELGELEELYDPIQQDFGPNRVQGRASNYNGNRRRHPRFTTDGVAELLKRDPTGARAQAVLKDLSELGCLVKTESVLVPGTDLKLVLNVANHDVAVRGRVRHAGLDFGLGVEFREIRKGDREILQFMLRKLAEQEKEEEDQPKHKAASVSL